MNFFSNIVLSALLILTGLSPAVAQETAIVLRDGLALPSVGRYGRGPVHTDALEAQIVAGAWRYPKAGDAVALPDGGSVQWARLQANKDGGFSGPALRGGYAAFQVDAAKPEVRLLEASGHNMVYVNGEPRVGDVYSAGWTILPVALKAGPNVFLFHCGRGSLSAKLTMPASSAVFNTRDMTLPDLVLGERTDTVGAVIVINATPNTLSDGVIHCSGKAVLDTTTVVPPIPPFSMRKVAFHLRGERPEVAGDSETTLTLGGRSATSPNDTAKFMLRVRKPEEPRKITFISAIDGSVQYYALTHAKAQAGKFGPLALFLSLHGASVEAIGQASSYVGKTWGNLVAPTNRRPYGFDWEDWGRLDAMEVLDLAKARFKPDPQRVYLTGHSMGGHGTWHIGVTYPDKFAAIGPSAGWISLFSYAGATRTQNPSAMQSLLLRPMQPSDTLSLIRNYGQEGVYILHGDADDNVPVTEAREMKRQLAAFHSDVATWEQPGAGHWWSADQKAGDEQFGAACVDWKPMFDFFAAHKIPLESEVRAVDFVTADPGVSAWCHWAGILAQEHPLRVSAIHLKCDPAGAEFSGTTENVLRLSLRLSPLPNPGKLTVALDSQTLEVVPGGSRQIWLIKRDGKWASERKPGSSEKSPERGGPFKQAFRNRMMFVFGTQGTKEENEWAYARARYDAESFWYRGNGAMDVVADTTFQPGRDRDRSVILYGNADTNRAWSSLLTASPVTVTRKGVTIGGKEMPGGDLACLFVRPRPGSDRALVAAVSGTGLIGMRLTERVPYFTSGVEYPDCVVFRSDMLTKGSTGVVAAGFFGLDWSIAKGEFVWQ